MLSTRCQSGRMAIWELPIGSIAMKAIPFQVGAGWSVEYTSGGFNFNRNDGDITTWQVFLAGQGLWALPVPWGLTLDLALTPQELAILVITLCLLPA